MVEKRKDNKNRVLKEGESQRKDGSYDYRWRTKDGKRHSIYAPTLEALREKEAALHREKNDGIKCDANKVTVNDIYDMWVSLKKGLKENVMRNYQYMYEMFVYPEFGRNKVGTLKISDVRRFYNYLHDDRKLKISTIDNIHTVLHQVLQLAVEDDYIRKNPSDNALKELKRIYNVETEKRRALTYEEEQLFRTFLKNSETYNHWYPIFIIMLGTGLRAGELTGLRWEDVDLENREININHNLIYYSSKKRERSFGINTPKTKSGYRSVPMTNEVYEAFIAERDRQKKYGIECQSNIDGYTNFIFVNRFGSVQHYGTLNQALKRIVRDCNLDLIEKNKNDEELLLLPNFSCHILRHTFATRLCEAGVNIKVIQDVLGHSDIRVTMDVYAEATKDLKEREFANFTDYMDKRNAENI